MVMTHSYILQISVHLYTEPLNNSMFIIDYSASTSLVWSTDLTQKKIKHEIFCSTVSIHKVKTYLSATLASTIVFGGTFQGQFILPPGSLLKSNWQQIFGSGPQVWGTS